MIFFDDDKLRMECFWEREDRCSAFEVGKVKEEEDIKDDIVVEELVEVREETVLLMYKYMEKERNRERWPSFLLWASSCVPSPSYSFLFWSERNLKGWRKEK